MSLLNDSIDEDIAVRNFRQYLRINTAHPRPDYERCKQFLFSLADQLKYERFAYECVPGKPFVVMTLRGTDDRLPALMLYSHTDVVPVDQRHWKFDAFAAVKDVDGKIYGRGTQDDKCIGIQYVEALRRLHKLGHKNFLRTIHIVWGPDEEIGGTDGMQKFVNDDVFKKLNVGFVLDEGLATEDTPYKVYYADKCPWWIIVSCKGQPGHGSRFIEDTAAEKLQYVINRFLEFRAQQKQLLVTNPSLKLCDVVTVNLTKIEGGVQINVLPAEMKAWFDLRVPPTVDFEELENKIKQWCIDAGSGVTYEYIVNTRIKEMTPVTNDNPWWKAFSSVFEEMNIEISKEIFLGATDSRFLRNKGYHAIGFTPINKTPTLLHDHNEYITEESFMCGIDIYMKLIEKLANVPK